MEMGENKQRKRPKNVQKTREKVRRVTMRVLAIDDEARKKIADVISYAKEHPYYNGSGWVPGDIPQFTCQLNTYRAVFTFTHHIGLVFRHLSVSIPGENYPHPLGVFMIASEFGFTGWDGVTGDRAPADWMIEVDEDHHVIQLAQEVGAIPPFTSASL